MGAYDANPRRDSSAYDPNPRPSWATADGDGGGGGDRGVAGIGDRFSGMAVSESSDNSGSIYQVMKAVEYAENTIKQQKLEFTSRRPHVDAMRDIPAVGTYMAHVSNIPGVKEAEKVRWMESNYSMNPPSTLVVHQNVTPEIDNPALQTSTGNHQYSERHKVNGSLQTPGVRTSIDSDGVSQLSAPSSRSLSPTRHKKEGGYDPRFNSSGQGLVPVTDSSSNNLWKQDIAIKVREHEEEIAMLRKHLADYSVKETLIRNEKYVLEKRVAYMRMAFDQQQQDLVDAASKALSYRQDIIEENIRLTYALQAAQQERTTFVSSLLPLLTEYNLQPSVPDAQSIVSNLKVLFKHLQEKLILTEDKLKESQYQLAPWRTESLNNTSVPPQSPSHSLGATILHSSKNLEIVPQPAYSHAQSPISSPSNVQTKLEWEASGNANNQPGPGAFPAQNSDQDDLDRMSPSLSRKTMASDTSAMTMSHDSSAQATPGGSRVARFSADLKDQNPSFKDFIRGNEIDDPEPTGMQHGKEGTVHWGPGPSSYLSPGLDDPNTSYPYLPPVLEEPSSSFSEAAEDDPLPAVEGLQISGEPYPGRELQASGYSINGTTSCNFEWVRYLEDGSVNYIEGAQQPKYLVTADDVDSYLAIEVHPLDDRKRKGELVKVFANEQQKITCDHEMQEQIEKTLSIGHMSQEVLLSAKYLDIWEQAVLAIKREGYSIKCNGPRGVVVTEKFLPTTDITIPFGHPTDFSIHCSNGNEYILRAKGSSWFRDTIVLTMRLFKRMALEKRKVRKKGLFFKS